MILEHKINLNMRFGLDMCYCIGNIEEPEWICCRLMRGQCAEQDKG